MRKLFLATPLLPVSGALRPSKWKWPSVYGGNNCCSSYGLVYVCVFSLKRFFAGVVLTGERIEAVKESNGEAGALTTKQEGNTKAKKRKIISNIVIQHQRAGYQLKPFSLATREEEGKVEWQITKTIMICAQLKQKRYATRNLVTVDKIK